MVSRRMFLRGSGVVLGATALGAASACSGGTGGGDGSDGGGGGGGELRFAWWGHEEMNRTTNLAIELYNSRQSDVTVLPENASWDDFWDRMATQIAGGNGADVFQMSNQMIVDYTQRGALLDWEPYIGDLIDISGYREEMQSYGVIDGARTGIPISTDGFTVLADLDKLEELGVGHPEKGWTWEELAEAALAVHDASGGDIWGVSDGSGRYEVLEPWVRGRGKTFFNAEATPVTLGFDKDDLAEFFEYWNNLRDNGGCLPADVQAEANTHETSALVAGTGPFYFTTTSELNGVRALTPARIQPLPMPDQAGGSKKANFIRPNLFMSAWEGTSQPEEAAKFLDFWINDPEAVEVIGNSRGVPPNPASAEIVEETPPEGLRSPSDYLDLIAEIGDPMDRLTPRSGREVYQLLGRTAEEIRFGQTNVPDAVESFWSQAESILG